VGARSFHCLAKMLTSQPLVTIILPIRNEAAHIQRTLAAVLAQDYPSDRMQILVVDGMSDDGTRDIVSQFAVHNFQFTVRLLDNPRRIVASALNIGLAHAQGDVIVRVDGHTEIAPDYVRQCVEALQRTGADNVGGRMRPVGQSAFGEAVAIATSSPFGIGSGRFHYADTEEWVDTVYLGAWPKEVFQRIGGFDEELIRNQDDEFNYRLRKAGGRILLSPKIRSHYVNRGTPASLWRQYYQYGYWKVRVLQKHPRQMQWRQFVPPLFVAVLLLGPLLALLHPLFWTLWLSAISLYLLAVLIASVRIAARQGWQHLLRLPLIFAILHISYGLGFLVGLFAFASRWSDPPPKPNDAD